MRNKVYAHLERFIPPGSRILELNAGTGTDALELARRGYIVHATDIAPGMLERLQEKVQRYGLAGKVTWQQCSFTELEKIEGAPFDAVFSNLGGLNCIPDLSPIIGQLPGVLRPGGFVTWVIMPPVCLWEMAEIFRGHPRLAFRRFGTRGTRAQLEGLSFTVYYFTPGKVRAWFGESYDCLAIEGLAVITPTAESKNFAKRYPHLYRTLSWIDDRLAARHPWRGWGDFLRLWGEMLKIDLPSGAEFALMAVYLAVVYTVVRPFDASAQAGFGIGLRIMQSGFLPIVALGFAVAPVAGQNFGARRPDRVRTRRSS